MSRACPLRSVPRLVASASVPPPVDGSSGHAPASATNALQKGARVHLMAFIEGRLYEVPVAPVLDVEQPLPAGRTTATPAGHRKKNPQASHLAAHSISSFVPVCLLITSPLRLHISTNTLFQSSPIYLILPQ
ncbi:hypothetical protein C8Q78DRAFT_1002190 [Trametes maxima]|nr:hypothetical protein C8Q78DRAFT_1002190 [Trametes maxima]